MWAPSDWNWRILEKLNNGDTVIHYRTTKAKQYPARYVGYSRVKSRAKRITLEELKKILSDSGILDKDYEDFFNEKTRNHNEFYIVELEDFKEFDYKIPHTYIKNSLNFDLQGKQTYILEISKPEIGETIIEMGLLNSKTSEQRFRELIDEILEKVRIDEKSIERKLEEFREFRKHLNEKRYEDPETFIEKLKKVDYTNKGWDEKNKQDFKQDPTKFGEVLKYAEEILSADNRDKKFVELFSEWNVRRFQHYSLVRFTHILSPDLVLPITYGKIPDIIKKKNWYKSKR